MEIKVIREPNEKATPGEIHVDGAFICYSLEDLENTGVKGSCAVPLGKYQVKPRFEGTVFGWMKDRIPDVAKYGIPHIYNIDGLVYPKWIDKNGILANQFVLIHIGNRTTDTEGCLLTGSALVGEDQVSGSTVAFQKLYDQIKIPMSRGELTIEYVRA